MPPRHLPPRPNIFPFVPADNEAFGIRVQRVEQNRDLNQHSNQAHAHHFPQIIYFGQGGGTHRIGAQQWEVQAGDLFLIAPYEVHDASNWGIRWVLQFTVDAIVPHVDFAQRTESKQSESTVTASNNSLLSTYSNPLLLPFLRLAGSQSSYFNIPVQKRPVWLHYLHALEAELRNQQPTYKEAARAFLTLILIEIARLATERTAPLQEQPLLAKVFQIIDARYSEPLSLADVAEAVNKSAAYLTTYVRQLTGRTVLEWIMERRMAEARMLLLRTDAKLSAIASQLGYGDTNSFIRLFRRLYGLTPGQWRRFNR